MQLVFDSFLALLVVLTICTMIYEDANAIKIFKKFFTDFYWFVYNFATKFLMQMTIFPLSMQN